ncbi:MAG: hypothetical protein HEQ12_11375 [Aphanizomenon flos-aquae DEX188]|jgi:hypothetical protein|nr:hypothetical protein [Nostocales cyanobacterium W4_Combined_metabat2_030]QSV67464.1 MAG: hypothetical protein HEQ12_11375 [Aphanizomenon flos-aquae DEX188]
MSLGDFRAVFLPYCLQKEPDGRYRILNRRYKPVGLTITEFINYEDYPVCVNLKSLGQTTAAKLSWKGDPDTDKIYLYNDGCVPTENSENMQNYLKRLEILAKLKVS